MPQKVTDMSIKDRFKMIMERENLTAGAFAEKIGVAQATISHILSARNKYPSTEVILRLHQQYSDINLEWLLTGEGSMTADGKDEGSAPATDAAAPSQQQEYPLFAADAPAAAGLQAGNETAGGVALNQPGYDAAGYEPMRTEIVYRDRPQRKITEIRIFFDDNTYETFCPEKK